ncbi:MAG: hypothetical protein KDH15_03015 [Rhodocyclaceae bacterium]|nr:hypothetical protein [Rhodocyclaceae bacterium]
MAAAGRGHAVVPFEPQARAGRPFLRAGRNSAIGHGLAPGRQRHPHQHPQWVQKGGAEPCGSGLARRTGRVPRCELVDAVVVQFDGVDNLRIIREGMHLRRTDGGAVAAVGTIACCAGQEFDGEGRLAAGMAGDGIQTHRIGAAVRAGEPAAMRAVDKDLRPAPARRTRRAGRAEPGRDQC